MKSKNCLLTGSNGFLGKIVFPYLEKKYNVIRLGRTEGDLVCDITKSIPKLDCNLDLVIHMAGKAHEFASNESMDELTMEINYGGTVNLLEGIRPRMNKDTTVVFISSVAVYGLETGHNIAEKHIPQPKNMYAISKLKAEKWLMNYCKKVGCKLTILRLPLVIGPHPVGNLALMLKSMKNRTYISIGDGQIRKSMVLAKDVGVLLASDKLASGVFNLTDGIHPMFSDFEVFLIKNLRIKKPWRINKFLGVILGRVGDFIGHPFPVNSDKINKLLSNLTFDDSKARREMLWNPESVLDNKNWINKTE